MLVPLINVSGHFTKWSRGCAHYLQSRIAFHQNDWTHKSSHTYLIYSTPLCVFGIALSQAVRNLLIPRPLDRPIPTFLRLPPVVPCREAPQQNNPRPLELFPHHRHDDAGIVPPGAPPLPQRLAVPAHLVQSHIPLLVDLNVIPHHWNTLLVRFHRIPERIGESKLLIFVNLLLLLDRRPQYSTPPRAVVVVAVLLLLPHQRMHRPGIQHTEKIFPRAPRPTQPLSRRHFFTVIQSPQRIFTGGARIGHAAVHCGQTEIVARDTVRTRTAYQRGVGLYGCGGGRTRGRGGGYGGGRTRGRGGGHRRGGRGLFFRIDGRLRGRRRRGRLCRRGGRGNGHFGRRGRGRRPGGSTGGRSRGIRRGRRPGGSTGGRSRGL
mmetsp:Transcript_54145/g.162115  ORF Transcript_54145/g.162115 Transcript_54145/m.162115 type:complete len:376 (-) Transcript_54145:1480-2607(-)